MTAINLKNIIEIAQRKIAVVDSNSSTRDLENLMEITMLTGGGHKADSGGFDSDVSNYVGRVVFIDSGSEGFFKFNQTIAGAPSATPNQNFTQIIKSGTYTTNPSAGGSYGNRLGSNYGYAAGGRNPGAPTASATIDKVSLASDGNATDVGDNPSPIYGGAGVYSDTHGYIAGDGQDNSIWKYAFASDGNSSDTGYDTTRTAPQSLYASGATSQTHGYAMGGAANYNLVVNVIDRFPFAVEANSTDVGDLQAAANFILGNNSSENGYAAGGQNYPGSPTDMIQKFPFASATTNATDTGGNLLTSRPFNDHGQQSETHGYVAGGNPITNVIEKFTFATDGDATDVGDLTITTRWGASASSAAHGYSLGGYAPPGYHNVIQKFSMSSDQNATDVGDLTVNRDLGVGAQY